MTDQSPFDLLAEARAAGAPALTAAQFTAIRLDPREHSEVVTVSEARLEDGTAGHDRALTRAVLDAVRTGVPAHIVRP
ncbi:hypothetical protein [Kitasatospora sp. NPDC058046]|uniref:hypothetical protein n=1 Tax=Kitasatospora sp. NPDC058046 TaxID=3346312 RepID=UPI0036DE5BA4